MTEQRRKNGTFLPGTTGNPNGRPNKSRNKHTKRREEEQRAFELAFNALDVVSGTLAQIRKEAPLPDRVDTETMIGLVGDVCDGVKEDIEKGHIGPSDIAVARSWFENHAGIDLEEGEEWDGGEYFAYLNLPRDATWEQFSRFYFKGGTPDIDKMAADLANYPPIQERVAYLKAEKAKAKKSC